jgi:phosphatidylglycerol lysyltransferase
MNHNNQRNASAENVLIVAIMVWSTVVFCSTFFPVARISIFFAQELEMKRITERIISLVFIIMSYNLMQRRRTAWFITMFLLLASLVQHLLPPANWVSLLFAAIDLLALLALFRFRGDFCCPSAHESIQKSLFFMLAAAAAILLNAGISYHLLKTTMAGSRPGRIFLSSLSDSLGIVFGALDIDTQGLPGAKFETYMFWFTWVCILAALFYALRPFIARQLWNKRDMQRARSIVLRYGQNPASYLTLERDKYLYFSRCAEGVVAYGVVGSTVLVNGDPICAPEDFRAVLGEFQNFCTRSSHKLIFLDTTDVYLNLYRELGFGTAKCGEEARFLLSDYNIAGKKGAKMRMNVNHATKCGLTVSEYKPLEKREPVIETAFQHITDEWLADKKSSMLSFTLGTVGLDDPMDKRYFYAADSEGVIKGFHVFCPFAGGEGYMADITRRTHDAPSGITEKINYEAFRVFKEEGFRYASLGLAPFANLCQDADANSVEKVLNFAYEHLNACYGFKNLYQTKASYSPTEWIPGYYVFSPKFLTPAMMYAIVRIQNNGGVHDFAKAFLPQRRERQRS